jgi:hypothetical protein
VHAANSEAGEEGKDGGFMLLEGLTLPLSLRRWAAKGFKKKRVWVGKTF